MAELNMTMELKKDTKTCYRFERRDETGNLITLYLKKSDIDGAGIDPTKGIAVCVSGN